MILPNKNLFKNNSVSIDPDKKFQLPVYSDEKKKILEREKEKEKNKKQVSLNRSDLNDEVLSGHYEIEDEKDKEKKVRIISLEHTEELKRLYDEADKYAERAREEAYRSSEIILNHTLASAKEELAEAARLGYAEGFAEGKTRAESVIAPALKKIEAMMTGIKKIEDSLLWEFRDKMFAMVSESAKKLVHKEISENDSYIVSLFSDAMRDLRAEEYVTVTVSEYDIDFVTAHKQLFLAEIGGSNDFRIIADKDSRKGTLIIETEKSVVDASVEVQLKNLDALFEKLKANLSIESIKEAVSAEITSAGQTRQSKEIPGSGDANKITPFIPEKIDSSSINQKENIPSSEFDEDDAGYGMDFDDLMLSEEDFERMNLNG